MKFKSTLACSFLAILSALLPTPSGAQIVWTDFQILGCQGGFNSNTLDSSNNIVIHTSQPSFSVVVTTQSSSATGLIGETCAPINAAYPALSLTDIGGVQDLWTFNATPNDSAASGDNFTPTVSGGGCPDYTANAPTCATQSCSPLALGQAWNPSGCGSHDSFVYNGATGNPPNFSGFAGFTIEVWVKYGGAACQEAGGCTGGDWPILINCSNTVPDQCMHIVIRPGIASGGCGTGAAGNVSTNTAGTVYWGYFADDICGAPPVGAPLGQVTDLNWHHLAFVASGGSRQIFQDGVLVSGSAAPTTPAGGGLNFAGVPPSVSTPMFAGGVPSSFGTGNNSVIGAGQYANGEISNMRIYSQALTQGEIAAHALGQWFSVGGDTKFDGQLSGKYCPGAGQPATPTLNWAWSFPATHNLMPNKAGTNQSLSFLFTDEDTNEFIGESSAQNIATVDDQQATMTIPPDPSMTAPFNQTQLSYTIPTWFCSTVNTKYTYGQGNCGSGNCTSPLVTPVTGVVQASPNITYSGLTPNTRYDVNVAATYIDAAPGDGVSIGPSPVTPSTAAATLAWPPDVPSALTTTGPTSVNLTLNLTLAGDVPANPAYTAIQVQGSANNGGTWSTASGFEAFNAVGSSPRAITSLRQSSKYIFRAQNENLDGITTTFSNDTFSGLGESAVTQPLTPTAFTGTSAQGTPGLSCPKTQILWTWDAVTIGSNQPPAAAATTPEYLLTDQANTPISPGSFPACPGCQTTTSFLQGGVVPLTPGTGYQAQVYSFDSGAPSAAPDIRFSAVSPRRMVTTANALILPPTGVAGQSLIGAVQWTWNAPPNLCAPDQYTVFDARTGVQLTQFDDPGAVLTYTENGLGPNQEVAIQVQAFDGGVGGVAGDVPSALTRSVTDYSQAFPPINMAFTGVSTGGIVVNWVGNGNPAYTRYELSYSPDNFTNVISTPYPISANLTGSAAGVSGLLSGTTYFFRVRAFNGSVADGFGSVFTSFLTSPSGAATLFGAPAVTGTALTTNFIDWYWPSVPSVAAYQVFQTPPGGLQATIMPPYGVSCPGGVCHYPGGVPPGTLATNTQYGVQVLALNGAGLASPSPVVEIYTLAGAPGASSIVGVTSNTITYQWGPGPNPPGTFYEVDVATNAVFSTVVTTVTPPATSITVTGLFPLTTYFAQLRAYNGDLVPVNPYELIGSTRTNGDPDVSQSTAPPTVYQIATGAAGQWHFDEDTGTVSADFSGFGDAANLTCISNGCVSTPTWTSGPPGLGSAVSLTGQTSSFVLVNDAPQFHFPGASLTMEAWVNPALLAEVNGAGLIAKGPFNAEDFFLDIFSSKYRFSGCSGGAGAATSAQSIVPNQWTHVAGTYNFGTGINTIYVNGIAAGTGAGCARGAATAVNVSIGNRRSGDGSYDLGYSGAIDEVRVIDGLYSPLQIKQDYAASFASTVTMMGSNSGLQLVVPPNAFGGPATIYVSNDPVNHPLKISVPELILGLANEPTRQILVPGMLVEIVPIVNGAQFTGPLASTVTVTMTYNDPNNTGLIQNVTPAIAASTLRVYTLDTSVGQWDYLPTVVNTSNHTITFQTPHFSTFGAFGTASTGNTTTEARIYPVPWKQGSGGAFDAPNLTIDTLPSAGTVRIFTLAGQKVIDLPFTPSNTGTVLWNGANSFGKPVASGVYFAVITTSGASTRVIKFAIER